MSSIVGNFAVSGMQSDRSLGSSGLNGRETGADGPVWASGRLGMAVAKENAPGGEARGACHGRGWENPAGRGAPDQATVTLVLSLGRVTEVTLATTELGAALPTRRFTFLNWHCSCVGVTVMTA